MLKTLSFILPGQSFPVKLNSAFAHESDNTTFAFFDVDLAKVSTDKIYNKLVVSMDLLLKYKIKVIKLTLKINKIKEVPVPDIFPAVA